MARRNFEDSIDDLLRQQPIPSSEATELLEWFAKESTSTGKSNVTLYEDRPELGMISGYGASNGAFVEWAEPYGTWMAYASPKELWGPVITPLDHDTLHRLIDDDIQRYGAQLTRCLLHHAREQAWRIDP